MYWMKLFLGLALIGSLISLTGALLAVPTWPLWVISALCGGVFGSGASVIRGRLND